MSGEVAIILCIGVPLSGLMDTVLWWLVCSGYYLLIFDVVSSLAL